MSTADPDYLAQRNAALIAENGSPQQDAAVEAAHEIYLGLGRGGLTVSGLPFPSPLDPLFEVADAIRALAEALSEGTGWITPSLANGFLVGQAPPQYRRVGDVVQFRGDPGRGTAPVSQIMAFNLPIGFRPNSIIIQPIGLPAWACYCQIESTTGNVLISSNTARAQGLPGFTLGNISFATPDPYPTELRSITPEPMPAPIPGPVPRPLVPTPKEE